MLHKVYRGTQKLGRKVGPRRPSPENIVMAPPLRPTTEGQRGGYDTRQRSLINDYGHNDAQMHNNNNNNNVVYNDRSRCSVDKIN